MKYILKGGTVVGSSVSCEADLLIDGEKIAAVGKDLLCEGAQVVDVTGKLLFPGFIDAHTHFDLDVCNTTTADDFASGTRSALRGGTTMVIDFACPNKGETLGCGLALWHEKADGRSSCDYAFHMTIDDWNEGIRAEIPAMFDAGIPSFKMYMTYPAMMIGDQDLYSALLELKNTAASRASTAKTQASSTRSSRSTKRTGSFRRHPIPNAARTRWRRRRWRICCASPRSRMCRS